MGINSIQHQRNDLMMFTNEKVQEAAGSDNPDAMFNAAMQVSARLAGVRTRAANHVNWLNDMSERDVKLGLGSAAKLLPALVA